MSPNCRLLCSSLVLMSFYQVHYVSSSSQNAITGQICCALFSTSKVWKVFSFRGLCPRGPPPGALPLDPAGGSAPDPRCICLRPCNWYDSYKYTLWVFVTTLHVTQGALPLFTFLFFNEFESLVFIYILKSYIGYFNLRIYPHNNHQPSVHSNHFSAVRKWLNRISQCSSIEHFLLFCPKYSEHFSSYLSGALDVSVGLLLGPGWDHRIARKDDEKLTLALFDFIVNTRRNF